MAAVVDRTNSRAASGVPVLDLIEAVPRFADAVVLPTIWETQRAVRDRAYGLAGIVLPHAAFARDVHRGVSAASVGVIRLSLRSCSLAVRGARAGLAGRASPQLRGRRVQVAMRVVNGLAGDHLAVEAPGLAVRMSVRHDGRDVELNADGVAGAFSQATERIAVFLHGLCDDEDRWSATAEASCTEAVREMGWTPTLVRFNSGLSLSENGVELARLLRDLTSAWPVPPTRIALIGHSLGGLIAHTATEAGRNLEFPWVDLLTDVVTVATPHLGSDLARLAAGGSWALVRVPETAPLAKLLDRRSAGIKDLGSGLPHLNPAPHVRYRLVSGQLRHPWGLLLGDLLVRRSSASGCIQHFRASDHLHLSSTGHLGVVRHPDLPGTLQNWLR